MSFPVTVPDIQIYAGDTYTQSYTFKDSAGDPIDLDAAGWHSWKAQYRDERYSTEYYEFQVDHSDAENGVIVVSMTADITSKLIENGYWDLHAKHSSTVKTFIASKVEVLEAITHV